MIPPAQGGQSGNIPPAQGGQSGNIPPAQGGQSGNIPPAQGGQSGNIPPAQGGQSGNIPPAQGGQSGNVPPAQGGQSGNIPPAQGGQPHINVPSAQGGQITNFPPARGGQSVPPAQGGQSVNALAPQTHPESGEQLFVTEQTGPDARADIVAEPQAKRAKTGNIDPAARVADAQLKYLARAPPGVTDYIDKHFRRLLSDEERKQNNAVHSSLRIERRGGERKEM